MPNRPEDQLIFARTFARKKRCRLRAVQNAIKRGDLKAVSIYGFSGKVLVTGVRRGDVAKWEPRAHGRPPKQ